MSSWLLEHYDGYRNAAAETSLTTAAGVRMITTPQVRCPALLQRRDCIRNTQPGVALLLLLALCSMLCHPADSNSALLLCPSLLWVAGCPACVLQQRRGSFTSTAGKGIDHPRVCAVLLPPLALRCGLSARPCRCPCSDTDSCTCVSQRACYGGGLQSMRSALAGVLCDSCVRLGLSQLAQTPIARQLEDVSHCRHDI